MLPLLEPHAAPVLKVAEAWVGPGGHLVLGLDRWSGFAVAAAVAVAGAAAAVAWVARVAAGAERRRPAGADPSQAAFDALARRDDARLQAMRTRTPDSLRAGPARTLEVEGPKFER